MPITNIKCEICNSIKNCKFLEINKVYTFRCENCIKIKKNIEIVIEVHDTNKCLKNAENINNNNDNNNNDNNNNNYDNNYNDNINLINNRQYCCPLTTIIRNCLKFFKKCFNVKLN